MGKDEDFWDKRSTILKYHGEIYRNEKKKGDSNISNEELFNIAKNKSGITKFDDLIDEHNLRQHFAEFSSIDIGASITIGFLSTLIALYTDSKGQYLENQFKKLETPKSTNIAASDYKAGTNHRSYFGHDILNPLQKLPEGFNYRGENIGGKTLYQMYLDSYPTNNNFLLNKMNLIRPIWDMIAHFLSDLPTKEGLPLPGSSYFTKWEQNSLNMCGFSSKNDFLKKVKEEYKTVNFSDITSTMFVYFISKAYISTRFKTKNLSKEAKDIFNNQVLITSYATGIVSQLSLAYFGVKKPSAKLNLVMLTRFLYHNYKIMKLINKEHTKLMYQYDKDIKALQDENLSFNDYVQSLN
tara:strand:- start:130 stop:1188 length:1059 start_codon:yes stop_codon:yes gene_type:complete